jgi:hypothetical protein
LGSFICKLSAENRKVLRLEGDMMVSDCVWARARAAFLLQGATYKVGVGSLGQLLLGILASVGVCGAVSKAAALQAAWQRPLLPADKVPSNTWLISMIAGGCFKESKRGIEQLDN